ncbi:uncharacterized protein LOC129764238 [Toxorhynchites rutilus septentrionalis]|uniref:uncharacterized protein LOC129764238 n=1 Tax=Toxorhynchites rutilus septentrionalis TaxID=329112 RepID=UPI00247866DF|nr:uncharacterized protein LOC129764238 [Toxorhynchites rutilus septentrionalis]
MRLLILIILIKTISTTNYKEITNSNGLVAFKIKTARIRIGYDRMLHRINLNTLNDNIENIEKIMKSFETIEHLEQTLLEKTKLAKDKLRSLLPHRIKRGLMNALGTAIKLITGNPDNDDLIVMHQSLGILKTQGDKLVNNQMKQIQINELFQNKLNNITDSISKIESKITKEYNTVQGIKTDLEFVNLIWNMDKIISILEDIEEQVEFSRVGLINKNILSLEEKQLILDRLKTQTIKLNYLDEIFQYTSASVGISNNQAVILIKTPILDKKTYDLLEIHTLRVNNSRIDTNINLVTKYGNTVYYQPTECDICDGNNLIEDDCIYKILTHQTPKCSFVKSKQTTQIKEVKQGIILIDTTEIVEVKDSCGDSRMVSDATIIETENCTVKIRNFTFFGQPDVTYQQEYLIPIYSKPLQNGNFTDLDDENVMLRIQNLEELNEVQLYLNTTQHRVTIGGTTLLIITFICFFSVYFYKKGNKRNEVTKNPPEPLVATQVDETENNGSIPLSLLPGKKTEQKCIPKPWIELPKLQSRTLET